MILPLLLANFGLAALQTGADTSTGPQIPQCVSLGFPTPKPVERRAVSSGVSVFHPLQCMQACHTSPGLVLNAFLIDVLEGS